ncbi:MAG: DUF4215 domain-containing protein [Proteobacteria bacterium]|nr:MAG: DUF4215 domain-containing protein [Pseudomonadota bacterium]
MLGARLTCVAPKAATTIAKSCTAGTSEQKIAYSVTAGQPFYIFVDSNNAANLGLFELSVSLGSPSCGDGLLTGEEQCDDGNETAGDGCSASCTSEDLPGSDVCPGADAVLAAGAEGTYGARLTVSTGNASANYAGLLTCGGPGRDRVVRVVPPIDGTMNVEMATPRFTSVLYARSSCADPQSQLKCNVFNSDEPSNTTRVLENLPVVAGQPVFLFADGQAGESGAATFQIVITPP